MYGKFSNVYFITKRHGNWTGGTIISDSTAPVIGFSETNDVSQWTDVVGLKKHSLGAGCRVFAVGDAYDEIDVYGPW